MKIGKYSLRWWTAAILMFAMMGLLAWDLFAFTAGDIDSTISSVATAWLGQAGARTVPAFGVGFIVGGLLIHFCGWTMPRPKQSGGDE